MWAASSPPGQPPPTFSVGVSFGESESGVEPFDFPLLNRQISQHDRVEGSWTGRGSNWPGDYYFDRPPDRFKMGSTERARGASGLLLLYVVHRDALGRSRKGKKRRYHTPFFGISIPGGGPDERRVVTKARG